MKDFLRLLSLMLFAPMRAIRTAHERALFLPALLTSTLALGVLFFTTQLPLFATAIRINKSIPTRGIVVGATLTQIVVMHVVAAMILVPVQILCASLLRKPAETRIHYLQTQFPSAAAAFFAAGAIAIVLTLVPSLMLKFSGVAGRMFGAMLQVAVEQQALNAGAGQQLEVKSDPRQQETSGSGSGIGDRVVMQVNSDPRSDPRQETIELLRLLAEPSVAAAFCAWFLLFPALFVASVVSSKVALKLNWLRAIAVSIVVALAFIAFNLLVSKTDGLLILPILVVMSFLLLRGYSRRVLDRHEAREDLRAALETVVSLPEDETAQYNLGLVYQQQGELDLARACFERTIQLDAEEWDAHYQLGRIAREQGRYAQAIAHFEPVVAHNQEYAMSEIWREVGATYLMAGQCTDSLTALETFLAQRPNDPEGWYLMGRARAGSGQIPEALAAMQSCIEAVKSAPEYMFRNEQRWLNKAEQFLKESGRS